MRELLGEDPILLASVRNAQELEAREKAKMARAKDKKQALTFPEVSEQQQVAQLVRCQTPQTEGF